MSTSRSFAGAAGHRADPERHRLLSEEDVLAALNLEPGMTVAELGAGAGRFTRPIAGAVGQGGRVFAIETVPEILAALRERCREDANVHPVEAPHHRTPVPGGCCHRVLMANLWAETRDPVATLREAARLLREDGRLIIAEWRPEAEYPPAPHPSRRIGFTDLVRILENHCWDVHRHGEAGEHCYYVEAGVSDESVQS